MLAIYVIAMIAICWHFSYGIWLFAAKWGITPGATARKRFGYVCAAFGVVLLVMGLASIWAFVGGKYPNVPEDVTPTGQVSGVRDQGSVLHVHADTLVVSLTRITTS
jgi:succinate dehydrogenase / fumarate reductase cytochrome b subunit